MDDLVDLATKKALITKQACFSQLTDEEATELAGLLAEKQYSAGDTIVTEGDPVDSVFFIVNGTADVRHITFKDNKQHVESVAKLREENAIGLNETGFYSLSGRRTATVVADTDMLLLHLRIPAFHGFALAHSHVSELMRRYTATIQS